jgi:Ca-activated chloride channel family protein
MSGRTWLAIAPWLVGLAPIVVVSGQQLPTFRAGVDVVTVDVSVIRRGHPVSRLKLENFVVFDNGVRQKLEGMVAEHVPLDATLVLDTSGSLAGGRLSQLKRAGETFLEGLSAQDRVSLITFTHQILVRCPLTSDSRAVRGVLSFTESHGATALYDATYLALRLPEPGQRRGIAVVFTDGFDNASWLSQDDVVDAVTRSPVIVYGVTLNEDVMPPNVSASIVIRTEHASSNAFLRSVSEASGGRLFRAATGDKLHDAFARVLQDVRARYLLRYSPDKIAPGWHKLEVRLQGAKGDVTARRGYFAAK